MINCIELLDSCIERLRTMQAGEKMELADQSELAAVVEQLQAARQTVESLSDRRWEAKHSLIVDTVAKVAGILLKIMLDR